jgi:DNA-binding NarL/FixJ family response regulator
VIRVIVADDHAIVREGIARLLDTDDGIEVVALAADGREAVAQAAALEPDVVLMDLSMPELDGVDATREIVAASPEARVVVLTSFADQRRILDALNAGASGYLLKDARPDEVIAAVHAVAEGGVPLDPKAARVLVDQRRVANRASADLTTREREVLALLATGLANKQIARQLDITERTVKAHMTRIFEALGVTDRTQAALWAREHLDPER